MTRFSQAAKALSSFTNGPHRKKTKDKDTMLCAQIFAASPAQHAGLEKGDILLSVNGKSAAALGSVTAFWPLEEEYVFRFLHKGTDEICLTARINEIGIRYERATPAIEAHFEVKKHQFEDLIVLWQRREWSLLRRLCAEQLHQLNGTAWLTRKVTKPTLADSPAALLYGIALWESGEQRAGRKFMEDFEHKYLAHWTADIQALSFFYQAKIAHSNGDTEKARGLNRMGCRQHRWSPALEWHRTEFREEPPQTAVADSTQTRFPDLGLKPLDERAPLLLSDFMHGTEPGRLIVFVCLGGYRGNGPTNELLGSLRRNRALLEFAFSPVVLITQNVKRPEDRDWWFVEEDKMRQENFPLRVMLDDGSVAAEVGLKASPEVFLVDRRGKIVYRGPWVGHHLWASLRQVQSKI